MNKQIVLYLSIRFYALESLAFKVLNHSTDLCLMFLCNKILKDFDKSLMFGMILIDLQKVPDTNTRDLTLKNWELLVSWIILLIGLNKVIRNI